jgi:hypothetical protein
MKETFKHPPTLGSTKPFEEFDPSNPDHYPDGVGVYIYGLRLDIEGLGKKFVPLCVGETSTLKKRLFNEHYNSLKTNGNNGKEIFNWYDAKNLKKVQSVYTDMKNYKESKVQHNSRLDNLIWYNHPTFFDLKLSLNIPNNSRYISGAGQMASVVFCGDLDRIYIVNGNILKHLS